MGNLQAPCAATHCSGENMMYNEKVSLGDLVDSLTVVLSRGANEYTTFQIKPCVVAFRTCFTTNFTL